MNIMKEAEKFFKERWGDVATIDRIDGGLRMTMNEIYRTMDEYRELKTPTKTMISVEQLKHIVLLAKSLNVFELPIDATLAHKMLYNHINP
jgi:hypothetical protein